MNDLTARRCVACEGGIPVIPADAIEPLLAQTPRWSLGDDGRVLSRRFNCRTFRRAMDLAMRIGELAEDQQHHPDLHLTGYRHLRVDLTTHAIGGLSENDFILAAHIDRVADDYP